MKYASWGLAGRIPGGSCWVADRREGAFWFPLGETLWVCEICLGGKFSSRTEVSLSPSDEQASIGGIGINSLIAGSLATQSRQAE